MSLAPSSTARCSMASRSTGIAPLVSARPARCLRPGSSSGAAQGVKCLEGEAAEAAGVCRIAELAADDPGHDGPGERDPRKAEGQPREAIEGALGGPAGGVQRRQLGLDPGGVCLDLARE